MAELIEKGWGRFMKRSAGESDSCRRPAMPAIMIVALMAAAHGAADAQRSADPAADPADLPVATDALQGLSLMESYAVRNDFDVETLLNAVGPGETALQIDLSGVPRLLDGTEIDGARIYGVAFVGPYPFEAAETRYAYARFRRAGRIQGGVGEVRVKDLLWERFKSEEWTDRGTVMVRLELYLETEGRDRELGTYDFPLAFEAGAEGCSRLPWLVEGPFVCRLDSAHPDEAVIVFRTDRELAPEVLLGDGRRLAGRQGRRHEIVIQDLEPATLYEYRVKIGDLMTRSQTFRTPPVSGEMPVRFAFCGDSREGYGGGRHAAMGVNALTLERLGALAYTRGAQFFVMGGDLINGYTTSPPDFQTQFYAFRRALSGFWRERPVYTIMGNHEALLRVHKRAENDFIYLDAWPYA
ncbi:MAG: hypothetical protein GF355_09890, partial [Candidatus Eisenbacteria bacterium]|nr:hypothetical protein [Candidatus Eisenbacteria bacterium]